MTRGSRLPFIFLMIVLILFLFFAAKLFADLSKPISNITVTSSESQWFFAYDAPTSQQYYRVFIDTDRSAASGYYVGKIYAKYLLQNNVLYRYAGPGWKWTMIKKVLFTQSINKMQWTVNRSDFGDFNCAGSLDYALQIINLNYAYTVPRLTLNYSANTNCKSSPELLEKIAVPSYFYPDCAWNTNCLWRQFDNAAPKVGLGIINPGSGPGTTIDNNYVNQVKQSQSKGTIILGYVDTAYANRNINEVKSDIDKFYSWYGVDGIFFDQGYGSECSRLTYYQSLDQYVKAKGGKGVTVINYGTNSAECYIAASDILLIFESPYNNYVNWQPAPWVSKYPPSHFWHLVYATPDDKALSALQLSKQRNAGWIYITPDDLPNPWDSLPPSIYWNLLINSL